MRHDGSPWPWLRRRARQKRGSGTRQGADPHRAPLEALDLPAPAVARLGTYLDTLAEWNRRINLTAAHTPEERVRLLVAAILPILRLPEPGTLLDVGSGNGSPGLVMAIMRDDLEVTLLEPRMRRWAFLREAVRRCGEGRVRVERGRHDEFRGDPARTVTVRALALPLWELGPLVAPGGQVLILGGSPQLEGPFEEVIGAGSGGQVRAFRRVSRGTLPAP